MLPRLVTALACLGLYLIPASAVDLPRQSPEFVVQLPNNQQILLSSYKGKVVAFAFILTTCPHCQYTCRTLDKMYKEYKPQGLEVIAAATNDMAKMLVPEFVKNLGLSFPVGVAQSEASYSFLQHPMMLRMYMPQVLFIDRKGVVRAQYGGEDQFFAEKDQENNIRTEILKLLKDSGTTKSTTKGKATHKSVKKSGA